MRYNVQEKKNTSNKIPINNNGLLNFNINSKQQKTNNMMNNLGNILNNNNINNKLNQNYQNFDENKKLMTSTNSSINFQTGISQNSTINKENLNPQMPQVDIFHKFKNRTSFDMSINDNSNNSLNRANSSFTQNKNYENEKRFIEVNNNNQQNFNQNFAKNDIQDGNDPNQLFDELNLMYANSSNNINSLSCIASDKDEKELNKLKESYYNMSNKLKLEQKSFNKEGNNSLVGMLQLLKMVKEIFNLLFHI